MSSTLPLSHETAERVPLAAPVGGWRRVVVDTLLVGGGTLVGQALGAVTSLLLRVLLDPAQMGIWQGLKMFLSYGNYANLGISKGAAQELCLARGRGDEQAAYGGLDLAHTVNTIASLAYAAVLAGIGCWIYATGSGPWSTAWAIGLFVVGGLAALQRAVTFQVTILRARQQFAATTRLSLLEAVATLGLSGLAVWLWGLPGVYISTAAVLLLSLAYVRRCGVATLGWAWDAPQIRRLVGIGFPILLAGVASSLFRSLDKLMILAYLPDCERQLGVYSLALMVGTQLYGLANMLSTVMGPRYAELLGRTGSRREVAALAARASELQAVAMVLPAGLAIVFGPPLLAWLLPEYREGLVPLVWLAPGVLAAGMALPASQYSIAVGQGRRLVAVLLLSTAIAGVANLLAISSGGGLAGVAAATTFADFVYLALLVLVSVWPQWSGRQRWRYVLMMAATLGGTVVLALSSVARHSMG